MSRRSHLALLTGLLVAATAPAAPAPRANWTQLSYKDADGKDRRKAVNTDARDDGYAGGLGLLAVAIGNDVTLKGSYTPTNGVARIKVRVRHRDEPTGGHEYTPIRIRGTWSVTIPKGRLSLATVYEVVVEANVDGHRIVKTYLMNVANN